MKPFDYGQAVADLTEFWTSQGKAMMQAQEQAGRAMVEGLQAAASGSFPGSLPGSLSASPATAGEPPADLPASAAEMARAGQAVMEMWTAAQSLAGTLTAKLPASGRDGPSAAVLGKMMDPRQWMAGMGEIDEVLGRMTEGPRLADLWDVERRYSRVLHGWMQVRRRELEHQAVVLEAWVQAGRRFNEELAGRTVADAKAPEGKALIALWTETANTQLLQTQRSEAFLATQREMIRATTELRLAQQELVEHFGKQYGFPTRTELDDVHRSVTEMRREMRVLQRELRLAAAARPAMLEPVIDPAPKPPAAPRLRKARAAR